MLNRFLLGVARWSLYGLVFFLPLLFFPWTTDMLEIHKQTLLVVLTLLGSLAWFGSMLVKREVIFERSWFHLLPIAYLAAVVWSAITSGGSFLSWIGNATQEYTSVLTIAACVVIFFLFSHFGRDEVFRIQSLHLLSVSAILAAVTALASVFGFTLLPAEMIPTRSFNTVGTLNALAIFLSAVTVVANGVLVFAQKKENQKTNRAARTQTWLPFLLSVATLFLLFVLDYWLLWVVLLSGLTILLASGLARAKDIHHLNRFLLPMGLLAVSLLFLFWNPPAVISIPVEITPSLQTSWEVATRVLQNESLLVGSGPGTYAFDFARYRPIEANNTMVWDVRFDRASSHLLTILPTLGMVTTVLWILFALCVLLKGSATVLSVKPAWRSHAALVAGWLSLAVAAGLYPSNVTLTFLFFALAGILSATNASVVSAKRLAVPSRAGLLTSLGCVLLSIGMVTVVFVTGQRYTAEIAFAEAARLNAKGGDLEVIIQKLDFATNLNRYNDVYYRNLSQALLEKVVKLTKILTVDPRNPISANVQIYIQELTAASINAAVRATELGPDNAVNWLVRGTTYRAFISLIQNAETFAREAYERAAVLEPTNPATQTEIGKTYLMMAAQTQALLATDDQTMKAQAEATRQQQLSIAEATFQKALELKKDYAPAHYQLALVFEQQGRLNDAIGKMESVARYNPLDVGVAFQLGILYLRRSSEGDIERAQQAFEQVIALMPSYSNARWFLASIYEQRGDFEAAEEQVAAVFELNPDNELVQARLERLRAGLTSTTEPTEPLEEGAQ